MLEPTFIEMAVAALMWSLTLVIPFRSMQARPDLRWDLIAVACSFAFTMVIYELLATSSGWAMARLSAWHALIDGWSWWSLLIGYLLLADLGVYLAHRLLHTSALWPTHAFHHSARHLNVLAGLRASPVHLVLLFAPPVIAFCLFPYPEGGAIGLGVLLLQFANQHYLHSNIRFPMERALEKIVVTPRMHFVHHSANPEYANSNFGFVFSVWDRLFGTFTDPDTVPANDPLGLEGEYSHALMLVGVLRPARSEPESSPLRARR